MKIGLHLIYIGLRLFLEKNCPQERTLICLFVTSIDNFRRCRRFCEELQYLRSYEEILQYENVEEIPHYENLRGIQNYNKPTIRSTPLHYENTTSSTV